ncbi:MAG: phosphogluconate dehydrogenase C-terminal domain-containing protein [Succinatimonas sp.]|nr:phosphogluconate dehydrogenase C-terminal domain-containing protein [Succinatimonas sp.]
MKIVLIGAGGKMGQRLTRNLCKTDLDVEYIELSESGRAVLKEEFGVIANKESNSISEADYVILAVPDKLLDKVGNSVIPSMKEGATIFVLDPAVAFANKLNIREKINIFISHPCHPPVINDETTLEAKKDFFGGRYAKQSIVNCLYSGDESVYADAESIAKIMYGPILRSHRVTVDQFTMLEPGLVETICSTFLTSVKEASDVLVKRGVDPQCVHDFLMGHIHIQIAVIFGYLNIRFSDAANKAIEEARSQLLKDDWMRVLEKEEIAKTVDKIIS